MLNSLLAAIPPSATAPVAAPRAAMQPAPYAAAVPGVVPPAPMPMPGVRVRGAAHPMSIENMPVRTPHPSIRGRDIHGRMMPGVAVGEDRPVRVRAPRTPKQPHARVSAATPKQPSVKQPKTSGVKPVNLAKLPSTGKGKLSIRNMPFS